MGRGIRALQPIEKGEIVMSWPLEVSTYTQQSGHLPLATPYLHLDLKRIREVNIQ